MVGGVIAVFRERRRTEVWSWRPVGAVAAVVLKDPGVETRIRRAVVDHLGPDEAGGIVGGLPGPGGIGHEGVLQGSPKTIASSAHGLGGS